jgi:hypothetical protein
MTLDRTGYLTMREAAAWLGMGQSRAAGRRLASRLRRLEARLGVSILRCDGPRQPALVTKATLRDVLPEHFSNRDRVEGMVQARFRALESALAQLRSEEKSSGRVLGARIRRLESQIRDLEEAIQDADPDPALARRDPP